MTGTTDSRAGSFSPEWLALHEPADVRARDSGLTAQLAQRVRQHSPVRFIDLACGTGANLRYLAPRLGGHQQWLLVDYDTALLKRAEQALLDVAAHLDTGVSSGFGVQRDSGAQPGFATSGNRPADSGNATAGCEVQTLRLDLATDLGALDLAPDVIVTASALLDLVSDRWLTQLVERCRVSRCTALFALSYDGRIALTPSDPDDEWIRQWVNLHQLGDKGFGPALGPGASQRAGELFRAAGHHVRTARSDWELLPTEQLLQQSLLEGWAGAAKELAPKEADRCSRWLERRMAYVSNGSSRVTVGHEDLLAVASTDASVELP